MVKFILLYTFCWAEFTPIWVLVAMILDYMTYYLSFLTICNILFYWMLPIPLTKLLSAFLNFSLCSSKCDLLRTRRAISNFYIKIKDKKNCTFRSKYFIKIVTTTPCYFVAIFTYSKEFFKKIFVDLQILENPFTK